jgi:uncharacterized oligopeptide transporter (OPT) family protein
MAYSVERRPGVPFFGAGAVGAALAALRDLVPVTSAWRIPQTLALPGVLGGELARSTSGLDASAVLVGAGAFIGIRVAASMVLGAGITYLILAPSWLATGAIAAPTYRAVVAVSLWPAAALIVASAVTTFAVDFVASARARARAHARGSTPAPDPAAAPSVPPVSSTPARRRAFTVAALALAAVLAVLLRAVFAVPFAACLVLFPLTAVVALAGARSMGETDVVPTRALAPLAQFVLAFAAPFDLATNVMAANVPCGVALHAADALACMRTATVVGARVERIVVAQIVGVVVGAAAVVAAYALIFPEGQPIDLPSERFPAPAVLVWANVSQIFARGPGALPAHERVGALLGAAIGVALGGLERLPPARVRRLLPSPAGVGSAMVLPASNSVAIFAGALLAWSAHRLTAGRARGLLLLVASGLIAGESLLGIAVSLSGR